MGKYVKGGRPHKKDVRLSDQEWGRAQKLMELLKVDNYADAARKATEHMLHAFESGNIERED